MTQMQLTLDHAGQVGTSYNILMNYQMSQFSCVKRIWRVAPRAAAVASARRRVGKQNRYEIRHRDPNGRNSEVTDEKNFSGLKILNLAYAQSASTSVFFNRQGN